MGRRSAADSGFAKVWLLIAVLGLGLTTAALLAALFSGSDDNGDLASEVPVPDRNPWNGEVVADAPVPYFDCPDGIAVGEVAPERRLRVVARDVSGDWLQIRGPGMVAFTDTPWTPGDLLWIRAEHMMSVTRGELPTEVATCEPDDVEWDRFATRPSLDTATTSTTTAIPDGGSTTTSTDTTTTTVALPTVGLVFASANPMWEGYAADEPGGWCTGLVGQSIKSEISATVTAAAGVQSVVLEWSVGGLSGSTPMTLSSGEYRATLGRFDAEDPNVVPQGASLSIDVTVRATDNAGRVATGERTVTLNDCTFG